MTILIIIIVLLLIAMFILAKTDYGLLGAFLSIWLLICLLIHIIFWAKAGYEYGSLATERKAFVETLNGAREHGNPIELATITTQILDWNKRLADAKYNRSFFLLRDYYDKRIEQLQPIR